ncbi:MAG: hypothetical protein RLZZ292_3360 [Bacteroidota bacterium]|jgi:hypothetical protein
MKLHTITKTYLNLPTSDDLVQQLKPIIEDALLVSPKRYAECKYATQLILAHDIPFSSPLEDSIRPEEKIMNVIFYYKSLVGIDLKELNQLFLEEDWCKIILKAVLKSPKLLNDLLLSSMLAHFRLEDLWQIYNAIEKEDAVADTLKNRLFEHFFKVSSSSKFKLALLEKLRTQQKPSIFLNSLLTELVYARDLDEYDLTWQLYELKEWRFLLVYCSRQLVKSNLSNTSKLDYLAFSSIAYLHLKKYDLAAEIYIDHFIAQKQEYAFIAELFASHHLLEDSIEVTKRLCDSYTNKELEGKINSNPFFKLIKAKKLQFEKNWREADQLISSFLDKNEYKNTNEQFVALKLKAWNEYKRSNNDELEDVISAIEKIEGNTPFFSKALNLLTNGDDASFIREVMNDDFYQKSKDELFIELVEQLYNKLLKSREVIEAKVLEKVKKSSAFSRLDYKDKVYFECYQQLLGFNTNAEFKEKEKDELTFTYKMQFLLSQNLDDYQLKNLIVLFSDIERKKATIGAFKKSNIQDLKYLTHILEWMMNRNLERRNKPDSTLEKVTFQNINMYW